MRGQKKHVFFETCTICPSFAQYVPMSWPSYPERAYQQRKKFGLYLEPRDELRAWGLRVHGVGSFRSRAHDMSSVGRVMDVYALVLVREGFGFLIDKDGAKTSLKAGDVLAVVPGWWHLYNPDQKAGWTTAWVIFDGPVAESLEAAGEIYPGVIASDVGESGLQALGAMMDGMIALATERADSPQVQARLAAEVFGLLARVSDWRREQALGGRMNMISESVAYVESHYMNDIDFDALLEDSAMSKTHFRRQFKRVAGDGPQTYQKRLRMRLAKELLRHSELSVSEVGERVGYSKASYFSRIFSNHVGVSPIVWRKSGM